MKRPAAGLHCCRKLKSLVGGLATKAVLRVLLGTVLGTVLGIFVQTQAFAEVGLDHVELLKTRAPRIHFWLFDLGVHNFRFTAPDDSKVAGVGASFAIGYGRIHQDSWINTNYHFLSGPWDSARNQSFDVDSSGFLIDVEYGAAFPGFSLRSGSCPTLAISGGFLSLSSKSIGSNRKNNGNPDDTNNFYLEQDFKTSINALVVTPAIGWNWVKAARPAGNEPELLLTRVESAYIRLSALVPLYSGARVKVLKRSQSDTLSQAPKHHTTTGIIRGYSMVLTTGVWLGI